MTAAEAATVILDAVRSGAWRVVVGDAAKKLDEFVRANPEDAYDYALLRQYRELPRVSRESSGQ
jgi:hypothetical protein